MLGFLANLRLGNGTLRPRLREELEAEGLVLIEEGLRGSVRYDHFRMPGRRFHGKVTGERIGFAISEKRMVAYCRSGRAKLANSEFSSPHLHMLDVRAVDGRLELLVDYDRADLQKISGRILITMHTPNADTIARELNARLGR